MTHAAPDHSDFIITTTSVYDPIWNDRGSGAARDGGFWHPRPSGQLRPLGSVGVGNYNNINGQYTSILVGANSGGGSQPAVAAPVGYNQIWTDRKSGAKEDGSFWRPVPPNGYASLGDVCAKGWNEPPKDRVWCVREDLVNRARFAQSSLWDDKKSGAAKDVSIWEIHSYSKRHDEAAVEDVKVQSLPLGNFRASDDYSAPDSSYARLPDLLPYNFAVPE